MKRWLIRFGAAMFLLLLMTPTVFAKLKIISRQEWGANEAWTYNNGGLKVEAEPEEETHEEQTEIVEADSEIERVVKFDAEGREYVWPLQYAKEIKFIVLHHTGLGNELPDDPRQEIKNIYRAHAVSKGWGDIGYHFLIDRQGNIYEGRKGGPKIIGGHALPVNKVSIGIALMGNYENEEIPGPMLKSTVAFLTELAKQYHLDPLGNAEYKGKTYPVIHGHKDNSPKIDPGKYFYQKFPHIRKLIAYLRGKKKKAEHYDFSAVGILDFTVIPPDREGNLLVRVKNKGEIAWNTGTYFENLADPSLPRVLARLSNEVAPEELGLFRGTIPKTLVSGMRMPEVSLVINGNIRPDKNFPVPIMVEGLNMDYEVVEWKYPQALLTAGAQAKGFIKLKNKGNFTWRRDSKNRVILSLENPGKLVEREVKPGEIGKFVFHIKVASTAGTYRYAFRPMLNGIGPFPDKSLNFAVTVEEKEKPVRIALSFKEKKPQITSGNGMQLFEGKKLKAVFAPNEKATVARLKNGGYRVRSESQKIHMTSPPRFRAKENGILELLNFENRPTWNKNLNDNLFRGILEVTSVDEKLTVINELPLEDYLKGIAEISNSDPKEKIKTIIILARSYAKYYRDQARKFAGKPYDLDDNPDSTQKYVGYGLELRSPNIVAAVQETAGKIVTFGGMPVLTPYFNQSDGRTRSAEEVWGWKDRPYLKSVPDTFCGTTELLGHGVGVSGCGATKLAENGKTAEEIIRYYLTGIEITD